VPRHRFRSLLCVLPCLLAFPAWAQQKESSPPAKPSAEAAGQEGGGATWYAQALARGEAGLNVTHFWSKGPLLRSETVVAGHKIVTIVNGEWYYAYDALTGQGIAIRRDPRAVAQDGTRNRPFGNEYASLMDQGAELVREETLLGRPTGVFRVTDRIGQRELWATLDEQHLPLRVEIYDRRSMSRRYTDYLNWQSQLAIPSHFFEPDPNADLERLEFADYMDRTVRQGPVGPVPVLYANLLHVKSDE
jgi:outer membrane lipoprotein-sorting protein